MAVVIIGSFPCVFIAISSEIVHVLIFLSMLLLGLAILILAIVWAMSQMLIAPSRMTDSKAVYLLKRLSPGDLGLYFEETAFTVRDEQTGNPMHLAAWWIPAPDSSNTVILLHGFADSKIGAIAWAPLWKSMGYNILAIDLRAHGESGGRFTTAGYVERHDIEQAINELRTSKPGQTRHLVLFGISLGAAVAAAVAKRRDDLDAIILDSPYHHFKAAAIMHGRYMNMPFGFLAPLAIHLGEWRCGAKFDEVAPLEILASLNTPTLLIFGSEDPLIDRRAFESVKAPCERLTVENAGHVLGIVAETSQYRERILQFLASASKNRT
jgi:pimeloyl-ACP methyl ester carboxylesterase